MRPLTPGSRPSSSRAVAGRGVAVTRERELVAGGQAACLRAETGLPSKAVGVDRDSWALRRGGRHARHAVPAHQVARRGGLRFRDGAAGSSAGERRHRRTARVERTIQVLNNVGTPVACAGGTPTVNNINAISVFNDSGNRSSSVVIDNADAFTPGLSPIGENGGTAEIEIVVNLHDASFSLLSVRSAGGSVRFGDSGINPNATASEAVPDADITAIGIGRLDGRNGTTANTLASVLNAQGGLGAGGPLTSRIDLQGNGGPDELVGGEGDDGLESFAGNDSLLGGGGGDTLEPGTGNDTVDGGSGTDLLTYLLGSVPSVALDLAVAGPQNTGGGGIESIAWRRGRQRDGGSGRRPRRRGPEPHRDGCRERHHRGTRRHRHHRLWDQLRSFRRLRLDRRSRRRPGHRELWRADRHRDRGRAGRRHPD